MFPLQPGTGRFIPVNSVNQVTAGPTSSSLSQARDMSPNKWHSSAINLPRNLAARSMTLGGRSWFLPFLVQAPVGLLQLSAVQTGESLVPLLFFGLLWLWYWSAVAPSYEQRKQSLLAPTEISFAHCVAEILAFHKSDKPQEVLIQFPKH